MAARLFRHGVASGEPQLTSLALWTRVTTTEAEMPLRWTVEPETPTGRRPSAEGVRTGTAVASYTDDHTVTITVDGLAPGTRYRYHFEGPCGEVSPHGLASTVPGGAERYRIGFVCCSRYGLGYFTAYRMLAAEGCDVVVHLGDYTYEDADVWLADRQPDPGYEARTLGDYRRRHAQHRLDADLQALHASVPVLALWDDHDVAANSFKRQGLADRQRRLDGQRAWREWLPLTSTGDGEIDRSVTVPGLVDLVTVDARYTGRPTQRRTGPRPQTRRRRPILSEAQWSRLERALEASSSPWRVIANQVQIGPMRLGAVPSIVLRGWRPIVNPDQWDGYPDERRRLYRLLRSCGPSLLVSGDLHSTWFRRLVDDGGRNVAPELTITSVAGESYAHAFRRHTLLPPRVLERVIRSFNSGIDFLDPDRHGYAVVDVTGEHLDVTAVLLATTLQHCDAAARVHVGRMEL